MSQESAKAFVERMKSDEKFRAKIIAVEDVSARVKIIQAEGFDCSAEEISTEASELSEEELSVVQGGMSRPLTTWGMSAYEADEGTGRRRRGGDSM